MKPEDARFINDHTAIMLAILENARSIVFDSKNAPTIDESLKKLLNSREVNDDTKRAIKIVLDNLQLLNKLREQIPADTKKKLEDINKQLKRCENMDEIITMLSILKRDYREDPNMQAGFEYAINILKAGKETIYNPEYVEKKVGLGHRVLEYGKVDAYGAIEAAASVGTIADLASEDPHKRGITFLGILFYGAVDGSGKKLAREIWDKLHEG